MTPDEFAAITGKMPKIIMWYENWDGYLFSPARFDVATNRGAVPSVTWEPYGRSVQGIANGQYDSYIRAQAQVVASYGKRVYIRPFHEFNGDWYSWSIGVNGNTPADLANAFRHIVEVFRQEGATNARWIWAPNVDHKLAQLQSAYPGDAYVDVIGMDGYNWGTTRSWSNWQSMGQVFGPTYDSITAWNTTKPFTIAETASTEFGGDKAAWIRQAYLSDVPNRLPRVQSVVWFHINKETDWRVNSSAAALDAYKTVINDPGYSGTMP